MGRVICFFTRQDITEKSTSLSVEQGEQIIVELLEIELKRAANSFSGEAALIDNMICMVENASGASRYDAMDRLYLGTGR